MSLVIGVLLAFVVSLLAWAAGFDRDRSFYPTVLTVVASWWVAAALPGHGGFDFVHGSVVHNPGMPTWWAAFCGGFDVAAGVVFAALLGSRRLR